MSTIGFIGLGEAGSAIASGLRDEGSATVFGYDSRQKDPEVRETAERAGVTLLHSAAAVAGAAEVIVSLTNAGAAVSVAQSVEPGLSPHHIYADYNSASPKTKRAVAAVIAQAGARFVDCAVMAAVEPMRHRVPVLASGNGAHDFADFARGLGMHVEAVGDQPGQAAAVKMFRSLLVKGLEALVWESIMGARRYGVDARVLASLPGELPVTDWTELASHLVGRTVVHGERRAAELREVAETLAAVGVDPLLAKAGAERLQWAADRRLHERFTTLPRHYAEVLDALKGEDAT